MIVDIAVPVRVSKTFHYRADPLDIGCLQPGSLVEVPFRGRPTHGFVIGFADKSDVPENKIRSISRILCSEALFEPEMLGFLKWISEYYCHPLGEVIAAAVPRVAWERSVKSPEKVESDLQKSKIAVPLKKEIPPDFQLSQEQQQAVERVLSSEGTAPFLLHGITGSGKTEVYMEIIDDCLKQAKTAIVLVPEISLTPQLLGRFSARFESQTAVLHSSLTEKERFIQWQRIYRGMASVVIGARSAIFAPTKNLGLIVVDEEHESSFKQEDSLRYHARDLAVVRAKMQNAKIILGSATPSLESYANAKSGKYELIELKKRVNQAKLPSSRFVNLKEPTERVDQSCPWLSQTLLTRLREVLKEGGQSVLYLNRLGYANFLNCNDCGHTLRCHYCDVSLTVYFKPPKLKCHYCGSQRPTPNTCSECQGTDLQLVGVGTEQIERELLRLVPEARIARLDRSVVKTRKALEALLSRVARREVDILIGTQMVAKGHDFPGIALVGIVLADASLNLPDFRAYERTFQEITQVAGRAGRAGLAGEVIIQSLNPEHPVLQAAANHQLASFYDQEIEARGKTGFPPSTRLAMLRFQHKNAIRVRELSENIALMIQKRFRESAVEVLGPSEAPLSRVKNLYRWQALLRANSPKHLRPVIRFVHEYYASLKSGVQMAIDVDPIHLW